MAISAYQTFAEQGLRTLALARRVLPEDFLMDEEKVEQGFTLLGIVAIIDPPRPEVQEAIQLVYSGGIKIVMIIRLSQLLGS